MRKNRIDPDNKPGPTPKLKDPVRWGGGFMERTQREWLDANGGMEAVRSLIDAEMARPIVDPNHA